MPQSPSAAADSAAESSQPPLQLPGPNPPSTPPPSPGTPSSAALALPRTLSTPLAFVFSAFFALAVAWTATESHHPFTWRAPWTAAPHGTAGAAGAIPPAWQLGPSARLRRRLQSSGASPGTSSGGSDGAAAAPPEADIAYFVQVSATTLGHLPRLLDRLHHPANHYALHFDRKIGAQATKSALRALYRRRPAFRANVFALPSELITYRGVSMLLNTLNAIDALLDRAPDWHYFINLSGADYPVVAPVTVRRLLGAYTATPRNFFSFAGRSGWARIAQGRLGRVFVDEALGFAKVPSGAGLRELPGATNPLAKTANFTLAHAEAWLIGSHALCEFAVGTGYARKLLAALAYSADSSEHFFASLTWNQPRFNRTIVPNALRHVVWRFGNRTAGQHPFYVDERDEMGEFLLASEVEKTSHLFIRKFKRADSPLMDRLDRKWNNLTHLQRVRNNFIYAVRKGDRDYASNPPPRSEEDVYV